MKAITNELLPIHTNDTSGETALDGQLMKQKPWEAGGDGMQRRGTNYCLSGAFLTLPAQDFIKLISSHAAFPRTKSESCVRKHQMFV